MLNIRRISINKLLIPEVFGGNIIIPVSLQRVYKLNKSQQPRRWYYTIYYALGGTVYTESSRNKMADEIECV